MIQATRFSETGFCLIRSVSAFMIRSPLFLLCSCLLLSYTFAQQTKPIEPESMRVVYLLDSTNQTLKPLPRETGRVVSGISSFHSTIKGSAQISGPASSFRVKSGKDLEFVVKCTNPENFELRAFKEKGHNRETLISSTKFGFSGKGTTQRDGAIAFDLTKYGESSFRFVVKGLEPGEYAFLDDWNVFDFGVGAQ